MDSSTSAFIVSNFTIASSSRSFLLPREKERERERESDERQREKKKKNCLLALQETHATKTEESYNVAALTVNAGLGECWRKQNVQRTSANGRRRDQR